MEQSSSWRANSHSASQTPRLLWNPKVYYCVHKAPPLVPIPRQMHPVYKFPLCFLKIYSNIILPSTPRGLPSCLFPSDFGTKMFYAFLISPMLHAPLIWTSLISSTNISWRVQFMKLLIMQSSPASRHFLPLSNKYSPQHPVIRYSQSIRSFLAVKDQVSHSNKQVKLQFCIF
jgi:hypothetical protein